MSKARTNKIARLLANSQRATAAPFGLHIEMRDGVFAQRMIPSGFGTGYRFYAGAGSGRYGQGMPASPEARALFDEPRLIYDTIDCD